MRRRLLAGEDGTSIVELGLALIVTALMSAALVTWMSSAGATMVLHRQDDYAVQDLRIAKELIGRELRVAERVIATSPASVTVWVDFDDDDFEDFGEAVTWSLPSDGTLRRTEEGGDAQVVASGLLSASRFEYDHPTPDGVRQIAVTLLAEVPAAREQGTPGTREISIQITLRNQP